MNKSFVQRIRLINARSFKDQAIELTPGVNVITGDSDSGKTNIIRNIQSVLGNDSLDAVRSRWCKKGDEASITVTMSDDCQVSLVRSENVNAYVVTDDGGDPSVGVPPHTERYDAVGRDVPDTVGMALGIGAITLPDGEEVELNLATQRGPAFFVDNQPSWIAKVLGCFSGVDAVIGAAKAAQTKCAELKAAITTEQGKLDMVQSEIDLHPLDDVRSSVAKAKRSINDIETAIGKVNEAEKLESLVAVILKASNAIKESKRVLSPNGFNAAEVLASVEGLLKDASAVQGLIAKVEQARAIWSALASAATKFEDAKTRAAAARDTFVESIALCPLCGRAKP